MLIPVNFPERSEGTYRTVAERLTEVVVLKGMGPKGISRARDFGKSFQPKGFYGQVKEASSSRQQ
jgi:hypothetical protein